MSTRMDELVEEQRAAFRIGCPVMCRDGEAGRLERLIFTPREGMVTGIVVHRGFLGHDDRVVPLKDVCRSTDAGVELDLSLAELQQQPRYSPGAFTTPSPQWQAAHGYAAETASLSLGGSASELHALRPERSGVVQERAAGDAAAVVVGEGMEVVLRDQVSGAARKAGRVAVVLLDPRSRHATHFVMRKGRFATRDLIVPLSWAAEITRERILLDADARQLDHLPEYRPDDEIGHDVEQALYEAPAFTNGPDFYTIRVAVRDGVVTLQGNVRDGARKREAEHVARKVRGVLDVRNELVADEELASAVEHALRGDERLRIDDLRVESLLGLVLLRGRVESSEQREEAARVVHRVRGVQAVSNSLLVFPTAPHSYGTAERA